MSRNLIWAMCIGASIILAAQVAYSIWTAIKTIVGG
jgi:hypothetical protein